MNKLTKNIFYVFWGESISRLLGFITTIYLIRFFTVPEYGLINIAVAFFGYAVLLTVHWLNNYGIRSVAAGAKKDFISNFISLRLVLSFFGLLLITFLVIFLDIQFSLKILIILFGLSLIPNAYYLDWFYQANGNLFPVSMGKIIFAVLYLILVVVISSNFKEIEAVGIAFFTANLIVAIYFIWYYYRSHKNIPSFKTGILRTLLNESFTLSSISLIAQLNPNLPIIIIGLILNPVNVGYFAAAYKLIFFILIIDRFYYYIYFPVFTKTYHRNLADASELLNFILKFTIILILPIIIFNVIYASEIIQIIFGDIYFNSVLIYQILSLYIFLTILNSITGYSLIALNQEKYFVRIIGLSVILNIIFMLILTGLFSIIGTAISVVLTETFIFVLLINRLRNFVEIRIESYIISTLIINILATIVILSLKTNYLTISIISGIITYVILFFVTSIINKHEWSILKEKLWS